MKIALEIQCPPIHGTRTSDADYYICVDGVPVAKLLHRGLIPTVEKALDALPRVKEAVR